MTSTFRQSLNRKGKMWGSFRVLDELLGQEEGGMWVPCEGLRHTTSD